MGSEREKAVAVFEYKACVRNREDSVEMGTVVARDETEAKRKLKELNFVEIRLKKVGGISGIFKALTADVK